LTDEPGALDVLIVGAGISGISMGAHLKRMCPQLAFALVERREAVGGTWDLFRYPGVRSDSDMATLAFHFAPWTGDRGIASGDEIRAYLERVVEEHGIGPHLRCGTRVLTADWRSDEALWDVELENAAGCQRLKARFLHLASGYYDYDEPHQAALPGIEHFAGDVVHPQFWPEALNLAGKRVVVVGSGATAVSLVPALAERGASVTMLQRTPGWMVAQPSADTLAERLKRLLPERLALRLNRWIKLRLGWAFFQRARGKPAQVAASLREHLRRQLGDHYDEADFEPPYHPWEQRLCLVPDGDLFAAIRSGAVRVVTERIAGFAPEGVRLASGALLPTDVLVTATGLKLQIGGGIGVSLDGQPVRWERHWFYRNCLFSNVPNLAVVFGYLNASWTLRADMVAEYVCRVLRHMDEVGARVAMPELEEEHGMGEDDIILYSSGYLQRAKPLMPKSAATLPWRLNQNFLEDGRDYRQRPVADGVLRFLPAMAKRREVA
jgi:cation diffusion facilitator CzcD-associated flavoprotein CzcO